MSRTCTYHLTRVATPAVILGLLVIGAQLLIAGIALAEDSNTLKLLDVFRNAESQIRVRPAAGTIRMGSFDARQGTFIGLTSTADGSIQPQLGHAYAKKNPAEIAIDAVGVTLIVDVHGSTQPILLSANGRQATVPAGSSGITLDCGPAIDVHWSITSGDKRYDDELIVIRPPLAGVFTIPALPIGLVYRPPGPMSFQTFAESNLSTTRIATSVRSTQSSTRPTDPGYATSRDFAHQLELGSTVMSNVPELFKRSAAKEAVNAALDLSQYCSTIGLALKTLAGMMGSVSAEATQGVETGSSHTLEYRLTMADVTLTPWPELANAGSDVVIYLQNARVGWLVDDEGAHYCLLGCTRKARATIEEIRRGVPQGLTRDDADRLIALDPRVGSPVVVGKRPLARERFVKVGDEAIGISGAEKSVESGQITDHSESSAKFDIRTVEMHAGMFAALGFGPSETRKDVTENRYTSTREWGDEHTVMCTIRYGGFSDWTCLEMFYDRAFGTLLTRTVSCSGFPNIGATNALKLGSIAPVGDSTDAARPALPVATLLESPIAAKYAAMGGSSGPLGAAEAEARPTPDGRGRYQGFAHGSIHWSPESGAHVTWGAIRDEWSQLGWEQGVLGYPTTDETTTPDGVGRFNHFQGGSVYWTPGTGAHEVHGAIRDEWERLGWEKGALGYPVSDEQDLPDGSGRVSRFQNGRIEWLRADGAVRVIRDSRKS